MENCIFCKIINKEIPCYKIYEDELVLAFLDIEPVSNGHTLIIPKKHYKDYTDIDLETLNHINKVGKQIYEELKEKLNFTGLKIVQNNGFIQEVKHYHMHLIPVYNDSKINKVEDIYKIIKGTK